MANGFGDGEEVHFELALANAERMVEAVDLPVTIDFEGGYATDADGLDQERAALAETGAIGCNFEDQIVGTDRPLRRCRPRAAAWRRYGRASAGLLRQRPHRPVLESQAGSA